MLSGKQLARALFERAAAQEAAELLAGFKAKAAAAQSLEDLWRLRFDLERAEREFQQKYDYRYSQLLFVFGRLVGERRVDESEFDAL